MSLQLAAKHLAAQGRGPDSRLVHMSPREVAGLQALAMAHGGSLSINPNTGLPEAGFLDQLLPTLIGVGAMAATGGAAAGIAPWMIGLGVGGIQAARTGNLGKGLMAGLGAYGGAGLGAGLLSAGAGNAALDAMGAPLTEAATTISPSMAGVAPQAATNVAGPAAFGLQEGAGVAGAAPMPAAPAGPSLFGGTEQNIASSYYPETPTLPTQAEIKGIGYDPSSMAEGLGYAPPPTTTAMPPDVPTAGAPPEAPSTPTTLSYPSEPPSFTSRLSQMGKGLESLTTEQGRGAFLSGTEGGKKAAMYAAAAGLPMLMTQPKPLTVPTGGPNPYRYRYEPGRVENPEEGYRGARSGERRYFNPTFVPYAGGGPVEQMSDANAIGANTGYPMANIQRGAYATPYQQPISQNVITGTQDTQVDPYTGEEKLAGGGMSHLGDYSDGGRLLRGPGDGVSDSIPAMIGNKQPARLADGEFVVPARIVSELGNGSTDAGARKLYAMMDRIQSARSKTTGKNKVAANSKAEKYLPA